MKVEYSKKSNEVTFGEIKTGDLFSLPNIPEGFLIKTPVFSYVDKFEGKYNCINMFTGSPARLMKDDEAVLLRKHKVVIEE